MKSSAEKRPALEGRTVYIPRMSSIGARMFAAVFRSVGIDSRAVEPSDQRTLELGALHSSGEECYPQKVTIGDFLRIIHSPGFNPDATAFFMPIAEGPCRFGQYAPYMRRVLDDMGFSNIPIVSPTSKNSYDGVANHAPDFVRRAWRAVVSADALRKCLLKTRPYETASGAADEAYQKTVNWLEAVVEHPRMSSRDRMAALIETLIRCRDEFRNVPARYTRDRVLIGVVGEIYCRLNTFSNYDAVRKIEAHGGEAWLSDMSEWVWYTNWCQKALLVRDGKRFGLEMLKAYVKNKVQSADEHALLAPFAEDFVGYEEPHDLYEDVLRPAWPYLPADSALGEMVLTVGKSIYLQTKGADGIIDISPFSCMNGIVTEAIHPAVARDLENIPVRNFYFDASSSNMERDLDIFMELARSYRNRKTVKRKYPACFGA
jgi:predicted nucleotide-binding protein (sugar kinase/HSP70/actin superfamily)